MPPQARAALRAARRAWPLVLAAWRRWEQLPEHEKERYRKRARQYTEHGRNAVGKAAKRARKRR
jgi:hypothetical protein